MWHNAKTVIRTHAKNGGQQAWAIVQGVGAGWLRIKPAAVDGVSNIHLILTTALANNRQVDVFVVNNEISEATLR
jgi:hypothetical protein